MLRALRHSYPDASITVVVSPPASDVLMGSPLVDHVLTLQMPSDIRWWHPLQRVWATVSFARRHLWSEPYDLAISSRWRGDLDRATLLVFLSGAPKRIGYVEDTSALHGNNGFDRFLTVALHDCAIKHEVQRNLDTLMPLGITAVDDRLEMWPTGQDEAWARHALRADEARPVIALALGAGHPKRIWPIDRFADLAVWLMDRDMHVVLIGGAGDAGLARQLVRMADREVTDLTNSATLRQNAAVLRRCSLFCGNDSGPMHIAAAVGVPVVEISCHPRGGDPLHPNAPERFGPWRVPQRIVRPERPAVGCTMSCRASDAHCIKEIEVDRVVDAIDSLLKQAPSIGSTDVG
jgi:heptosyltransferase-2